MATAHPQAVQQAWQQMMECLGIVPRRPTLAAALGAPDPLSRPRGALLLL